MAGTFQKVIARFTVLLFALLFGVSYFYCNCYHWPLFIFLFLFFLFYLMLSFWGKTLLVQSKLNPMSYLFLSFAVKAALIIGFAFVLMKLFEADQKLILLLYVLSYILASVFDFILLSFRKTKNESE